MTVDRVTLLRADMPEWLERGIVVVPPGGTLAYATEQWRHAIAVVEDGTVVLEDAIGGRLRLEQGAVFCLAAGGVVEIRNETDDAAVIATARRRR